MGMGISMVGKWEWEWEWEWEWLYGNGSLKGIPAHLHPDPLGKLAALPQIPYSWI